MFVPGAFIAIDCIHKLGQLVGVHSLQVNHTQRVSKWRICQFIHSQLPAITVMHGSQLQFGACVWQLGKMSAVNGYSAGNVN